MGQSLNLVKGVRVEGLRVFKCINCVNLINSGSDLFWASEAATFYFLTIWRRKGISYFEIRVSNFLIFGAWQSSNLVKR